MGVWSGIGLRSGIGIGSKKRTRPAVTCTQVSAWARRRSVKAWPLQRALQCGIELAEALRYIHNEYPVPNFQLFEP